MLSSVFYPINKHRRMAPRLCSLWQNSHVQQQLQKSMRWQSKLYILENNHDYPPAVNFSNTSIHRASIVNIDKSPASTSELIISMS